MPSYIMEPHVCLRTNMSDSFEFDRQDAVDLWEIPEPVITKFHRDAEKF